jgi:histidyl-tRNA synthetase
MALNTQPYKGTRDFYPKDKQAQNYIFDVWARVAKSFGYEQYDSPIVEPLDLYLAKTSEEIVSEQTYEFTDRGGRKVTLRPEMTPSVSRMVAAKRQELSYPLRWFSTPNVWRYERPQRGRLREHWQLNVDLFGVEGIAGDHEIISIADSIMQAFGAKRDMYVIKLNSRKLINFIFHEHLKFGEAEVVTIIRLVDKMHKLEPAEFVALLESSISPDQRDSVEPLLEILNAKDFSQLPDAVKSHQSAKNLHGLQMMLAKAGVTNTVFDITLMRGFDYYTDIVFEVNDTAPENNRSMFGGGRYDGLVGQFGVEPVATVGFGMGDVTITDFLITHKLLPEFTSNVDVAVLLVGDIYSDVQALLAELRSSGLNVSVDSTNRKLDKQIKSADKVGIKNVLIVGEQELESGTYKLKNLETSQEQALSAHEIVGALKQ